MPNDPFRILILGGTAEARKLAERLADNKNFSTLTSLAGRTSAPKEVAGELLTGGFGGVEGLRDFVTAKNIALIVDATHPFAARITANAAEASAQTGVMAFRLERPPWTQTDGDRWTCVPDIEAAVSEIPAGVRVLVTVGRQEIAPFFARDDIHVVARMIETPEIDAPANAEILLARPPFSQEQECALMTEKCIDLLVTKNSGGDATYSKIAAARALEIPVIMVERSAKSPLKNAASVDAMMDLIVGHFD